MSSRPGIFCGLLLAAALPCAAGAPADNPPPGYHDVTIGSGDHKTFVRVADSARPMLHGGSAPDSSGRYDPEALNFSKSSSMANKSFDTSFASLSKSDRDASPGDSRSFATHSFSTDSFGEAGAKFATTSYNGASRANDEFNKTYKLPSTDPSDSSTTFATKTSEFQGKAAPDTQMPSHTDPFATPSSLSGKTFYDPEMRHVRHDPYATGLDVKQLTDLPNRPLTIDEVRNLINHDQRPDLNSAPDEPSKALNDPNWEPPTVAPPERTPEQIRNLLGRDGVPTAPPAEPEKDDNLPAPGEIAQPPPEPLPK